MGRPSIPYRTMESLSSSKISHPRRLILFARMRFAGPLTAALEHSRTAMYKLSMVVVKVGPKGPSTLVLPVDVSGLCESQNGDNADYPIATLNEVDFRTAGTLF